LESLGIEEAKDVLEQFNDALDLFPD